MVAPRELRQMGHLAENVSSLGVLPITSRRVHMTARRKPAGWHTAGLLLAVTSARRSVWHTVCARRSCHKCVVVLSVSFRLRLLVRLCWSAALCPSFFVYLFLSVSFCPCPIVCRFPSFSFCLPLLVCPVLSVPFVSPFFFPFASVSFRLSLPSRSLFVVPFPRFVSFCLSISVFLCLFSRGCLLLCLPLSF